MAAAGVADADLVWMLREPHEDWLTTVREEAVSKNIRAPSWSGVSSDELAQHAAVTLGDGLALHKPSQGWQSPPKVLRTDEVKLSARRRGLRLHR